MTTNNNIQFSYYELSLLDFLRVCHPDKATDFAFIKSRADAAAEAYEQAFEDAEPIPMCIEVANRTLYAGLHFSKHDVIKAVLIGEFSEIVQEDIRDKAINLQPLLEEVFVKYDLSDDFYSSPEFDLLYTEITGVLQLKLEGRSGDTE